MKAFIIFISLVISNVSAMNVGPYTFYLGEKVQVKYNRFMIDEGIESKLAKLPTDIPLEKWLHGCGLTDYEIELLEYVLPIVELSNDPNVTGDQLNKPMAIRYSCDIPLNHLVRFSDATPVVKLLLGKGADPNTCAKPNFPFEGSFPLRVATLVNNTQGTYCLLAHGAKPSFKNEKGTTALMTAARMPSITMMHVLYGACPQGINETDLQGHNALWHAMDSCSDVYVRQSANMVRDLVAYGAYFNNEDKEIDAFIQKFKTKVHDTLWHAMGSYSYVYVRQSANVIRGHDGVYFNSEDEKIDAFVQNFKNKHPKEAQHAPE